MRPSPLLPLCLLLATSSFVQAAKFAVSGPVLTVTLKETDAKPITPSPLTEAFTPADKSSTTTSKSWLDLTSLRPNLFWSLASTSPPLPNWVPFWKSLRTNVGYRYDELKRLPSFVETELKFRSERWNTELQIKPTYELKPQRSNLLLQASRGASYILARFSMSHHQPTIRQDDIEYETPATVSPRSSRTSALTLVKASYKLNFPAGSALSSVRITPTLDVANQEPSCELEGVTASSRTLARLKLNYDNPTLAVVHALDDRNTISPEIALYNAKITYSWNVVLPGGSNLRARVDPTSAIEVQWTDTSASDGGRWVTDFRLPLEGTTLQALASDVKVRRQFNF